MSDMQSVLRRLAIMESWKANGKRFATVVAVKPGKVRLRFDEERMGDKSGQKPFLSPWIPTGMQQGFATETTSYEIGQQVICESLNDDFSQAMVHPYAESEHQPLASDAKVRKITSRIRKPVEKDDVSQEAKPQFEKKKDDDENDNIHRRDYEGWYMRKKKVRVLLGQPEKKEQQQQGQQQQQPQSGGQEEPERVYFEVGPAKFTMTDGNILIETEGATITMSKEKITAHAGKTGVTITKGNVTWDKGE